MITLRPARERGHVNHGWLDTWHSFSFASYYDPAHTQFGALRVINDDFVAGSGGFPPHPHRDMEIVTYILSGALAHKDSMGNGSVIRRGDIQRMSAGTGVVHSEFNASDSEPVRLLQIWLLPERSGITPGYEQIQIGDAAKRGQLVEIAARRPASGGVTIHQDARILAGLLDGEETVQLTLDPKRRYYLHIAQGALVANDMTLGAGDALKLTEETHLHLHQGQQAEVLLFDLA